MDERSPLRRAFIALAVVAIAAGAVRIFQELTDERATAKRFLCRASLVQAEVAGIYRRVLSRIGVADVQIRQYVGLASSAARELCSGQDGAESRFTALNALDERLVRGFRKATAMDAETAARVRRDLVAMDPQGSCVAESTAPDAFFGLQTWAADPNGLPGRFQAVRGADAGLLSWDLYRMQHAAFEDALRGLTSAAVQCRERGDLPGHGGPGRGDGRPLADCFRSVLQRAIEQSKCSPYADSEDGEDEPGRNVSAKQVVTDNGDGTETVKEYDGEGNLVEEYTRKRTTTWDEVTVTYYDNGDTVTEATRDPGEPMEGEPPVAVGAYRETDGNDHTTAIIYSDGTQEQSTSHGTASGEDEEGRRILGPPWLPVREVQRPDSTKRCLAFRSQTGTLRSYRIRSGRLGAGPLPVTPSVMDGFNYCTCASMGEPLPGHQCPADEARWSCLVSPFGPDDAPRPECVEMLVEDDMLPADHCPEVQCAEDEVLASFASTSPVVATLLGGDPPSSGGTFDPSRDCGCFPKDDPGITPAASCGTITCPADSACQCSGAIGCGCVPQGGDPIIPGGPPGGPPAD